MEQIAVIYRCWHRVGEKRIAVCSMVRILPENLIDFLFEFRLLFWQVANSGGFLVVPRMKGNLSRGSGHSWKNFLRQKGLFNQVQLYNKDVFLG